jgi:hypothetical protein
MFEKRSTHDLLNELMDLCFTYEDHYEVDTKFDKVNKKMSDLETEIIRRTGETK